MYIPAAFQVDDRQTVLDFLHAHPFGMLTVNGQNGFPVAAHLPFLVKTSGDELLIEGHLALENELAAYLQGTANATMMVVGAQGYVSSSVYTHVNVPTYNYQAVHLSGTVERMEGDVLLEHLREVVESFETARTEPIDFDRWPLEMIRHYMTEITGFRLNVTKTEAAFKLSQNRNETDFQRIVADLQQGTKPAKLLAEAMLQHRHSTK